MLHKQFWSSILLQLYYNDTGSRNGQVYAFLIRYVQGKHNPELTQKCVGV